MVLLRASVAELHQELFEHFLCLDQGALLFHLYGLDQIFLEGGAELPQVCFGAERRALGDWMGIEKARCRRCWLLRIWLWMTLFRCFVWLSAQLTAKVEGAIQGTESKLASFPVRVGYISECRLGFVVQLEADDGTEGAQKARQSMF